MAKTSHIINDILQVTRRSAAAKDNIRILELSSMDKLMSPADAEAIREQMLANKVKVRQLTNLDQFEPWTQVAGFIEECMRVRCIPAKELPIDTEVLLFDDTLAFYRVNPEPFITIIEDASAATQAKAWFDYVWQRAIPLRLTSDGSTSS